MRYYGLFMQSSRVFQRRSSSLCQRLDAAAYSLIFALFGINRVFWRRDSRATLEIGSFAIFLPG